MEYQVMDSGYDNVQVLEGFIILYIEDIDEEVTIDVTEVTESGGSHNVNMYINFSGESDEFKEKVLNIIEVEDNDNYKITDDEFVSELFSDYGSN